MRSHSCLKAEASGSFISMESRKQHANHWTLRREALFLFLFYCFMVFFFFVPGELALFLFTHSFTYIFFHLWNSGTMRNRKCPEVLLARILLTKYDSKAVWNKEKGFSPSSAGQKSKLKMPSDQFFLGTIQEVPVPTLSWLPPFSILNHFPFTHANPCGQNSPFYKDIPVMH